MNTSDILGFAQQQNHMRNSQGVLTPLKSQKVSAPSSRSTTNCRPSQLANRTCYQKLHEAGSKAVEKGEDWTGLTRIAATLS